MKGTREKDRQKAKTVYIDFYFYYYYYYSEKEKAENVRRKRDREDQGEHWKARSHPSVPPAARTEFLQDGTCLGEIDSTMPRGFFPLLDLASMGSKSAFPTKHLARHVPTRFAMSSRISEGAPQVLLWPKQGQRIHRGYFPDFQARNVPVSRNCPSSRPRLQRRLHMQCALARQARRMVGRASTRSIANHHRQRHLVLVPRSPSADPPAHRVHRHLMDRPDSPRNQY